MPDDVAALTWDAINIALQAIQDGGQIETDLAAERKLIRDNIANIKNFKGITGDMRFDAQGDPIKCAVVVKIDDQGEFTFVESVCPK